MAQYTTFEAVKRRLAGKVKFTTDSNDENKMSVDLANDLINEAEGQIEFDLSPRYFAPFQTKIDGSSFADLPERPTKYFIRTMAELLSCVRILECEFGRGTPNAGTKYSEGLEKRYAAMIKQQTEKKKDKGTDSAGWMYPPLPDLKLNYMNESADDGYQGGIIVANGSESTAGYAAGQINDPAASFWRNFWW